MKPIVVKPDKNGKISYTVEELEKLLEEVYNEGRKDGISQYPYYIPPTSPSDNQWWKTSPIWTAFPSWVAPDYTTTATSGSVTVNSGNTSKTILNENG